MKPRRLAVEWVIPVIVAMGLFVTGSNSSWLRHGDIYVSPQGSPWNSGRSRDSPLATLQQAADEVNPGETIVVMPGVYREDVRLRRSGTADRPVSIRALEPGTVTISGAAPDAVVQRLAWRDEGDRIWSAVTPWPVYHVIGDGENFFHVRWAPGAKGDAVYPWVDGKGRVERLRELARRPGAWGAFTYEGDRVYLAFKDGRKPQDHQLEINRDIPRPYASWSIRAANLWVEASHIRIEGLRFHLGVGAGIFLWNASDIAVSDVMFTGAVFGISNFPSLRRPDGLVVQHSFYNNYPQNHWVNGWLAGTEVYSHHSNSTLVSAAAHGIVARNNLVTHAGDGMELSTPDSLGYKGVRIYGNLLAGGTDDAIELDGQASRMHIHDNLISDFPLSLGLSPVLSGPVLVENNLFLHPRKDKIGAHLKLMNPWGQRGGALGGPIRNIMVSRNVFHGKWLSFQKSLVENVHVERNLFLDTLPDARFDFPPGTIQADNVFRSPSLDGADLEAACEMKRDALVAQASLPALFANLRAASGAAEPTERPGPRWLNLDSIPAAREVKELMETWLKVRRTCE